MEFCAVALRKFSDLGQWILSF